MAAPLTGPRPPIKLVPASRAHQIVKPSQHLQLSRLSTQEYLDQLTTMHVPRVLELLDIGESSEHRTTPLDLDRPLFQPFPSDIRFQNYDAGDVCEVPLTLTNMDLVARRIKLLPSESPYFDIIPPKNANVKVAPGVAIVYTVRFHPDADRDFADEIVCLTEREKFVIPVHAIGGRGILDIVDNVDFGECMVKSTGTKAVLLRNIGRAPAQVSFEATAPFAVEPKQATLAAGSAMQLQLTFAPAEIGVAEGSLQVYYETGETTITQLQGTSGNANVRLERSTLAFDRTYLGTMSQRSVKLVNHSSQVAHFAFKAFGSHDEEQGVRSSLLTALEQDEAEEVDDFMAMLQSDPTVQAHMSVLARKHRQNREDLDRDGYLYQNDIFSIEPREGDVWPHSEVDVLVTFSPDIPGPQEVTVYCDVTGREARLPLILTGHGRGPTVQFDFDTLDVGAIFVSSNHHYEIELYNTGAIPARFNFEPLASVFADAFRFTPNSGEVAPGDKLVIDVSLCAQKLGLLDETFECSIEGREEPLSITFNGQVVGPTFYTDVTELDFGPIAFGFPASRVFTLFNTSSIELHYRLRLPDGVPAQKEMSLDPAEANLPLYHHDHHHVDHSHPVVNLHAPPGAIKPGYEARISVHLTPQWCEQYNVALIFDIVGVADGAYELPIHADCVVPDVTLSEPMIKMGRCFLRHTYESALSLHNPSDFPAHYVLLLPDAAETGLEVSAAVERGVITPRGVTAVPLGLTVQNLGPFTATIRLEIVGSMDEPLAVQVNGLGQGPVVAVLPHALSWSSVPVLTDSPKPLTLSNESLIEAPFRCLLDEHSCFTIAPMEGCLAPGEQRALTVHTRLDDVGNFEDKLRIEVPESPELVVDLRATGRGATVVFDQDVSDLNFGHVFVNQLVERRLRVANHGRRVQKIYFSLDSPPPGVDGHCTVMRGAVFKKVKTPARPNPPDPSRSIFGVLPETLILQPGETQDVVLSGHSTDVCDVEEVLLCHGSFDNEVSRVLHYRMQVRGTFQRPLLQPDGRLVEFDWTPGTETRVPLVQSIHLENVGVLPVEARLRTTGAFQLVSRPTLHVEPRDGATVDIAYDPLHRSDRQPRTDEGRLFIEYVQEAPADTIRLVAAVHYPNLEFSTREVAFGTVMNETQHVQCVTATNVGSSPLDYVWQLVSNAGTPGDEATDDDDAQSRGTEAFDIVPKRGRVLPGATTDFVISYFAHANRESRVEAICAVHDGPRYRFQLSGAAAAERFKLSTDHITYSSLDPGAAQNESVVTITNCNDLPLPFSVLTSSERVRVTPSQGVVEANGTANLQFDLLGKAPDRFTNDIFLQVGRDLPRCIKVSADTAFPTLSLPDIPRRSPTEASDVDGAMDDWQLALRHGPENSAVFNMELDRAVLCRRLSQTEGMRLTRVMLPPYVVDMGSVQRNRAISRTFVIRNPFTRPVSVHLGKKSVTALTSAGFALEPEVITALPEGEETTLTATLQTHSSYGLEYELGPVEVTALFYIDQGPRLPVVLRANVCLPELRAELAQFDFGAINVGECAIIEVQLTNTGQVEANYALVKPGLPSNMVSLSKKQQDREQRRLHMSKAFAVVHDTNGCLAPSETTKLQVTFTPSEAGTFKYDARIHVAGQEEDILLRLLGQGVRPEIQFAKTSVELPPTLPRSDPVIFDLHVTNDNDEDVEIFNLEYDQQHRLESEIFELMSAETGLEQILLPPRAVGEPLPAALRAILPSHRPSQPQHTEATDGVADSSETGADATGKIEQDEREAIDPAVALQEVMDAYLGGERYKREQRRDLGGLNLVVFGPTGCDVEHLVTRLAQDYHALQLDLDELVRAELARNTDLAREIREFLAQNAVEPSLPDTAKGRRSSNKARSSESGPGAINAATGGSSNNPSSTIPGRTALATPIVPADSMLASAVPSEGATSEAADDAPSTSAVPLPLELLTTLIRQRVNQDDAIAGVIFNASQTLFATPPCAVAAFVGAVGRRDNVFALHCQADAAACVRRLVARQEEERANAAAARAALAEASRPKPPPPLDEDEYEALSPAAQAEYDTKVLEYRRFVTRAAEEAEKQQQALEDEKHTKRTKSRQGRKQRKDGAANGAAGAETESDLETSAFESQVSQSLTRCEAMRRVCDLWHVEKNELSATYLEQFGPPVVATGKSRRKGSAPDGSSVSAVPNTEEAEAEDPAALGLCTIELDLELGVEAAASTVSAAPEVPSVREVAVRLGFEKVDDDASLKARRFALAALRDFDSLVEQPLPEFMFVDAAKQYAATMAKREASHHMASVPEDEVLNKKRRPISRGTAVSTASNKRPNSSKKLKKSPSGRARHIEEEEESGPTVLEQSIQLDKTRWIIPAHSAIAIRMAFHSDVCGVFDQALNFVTCGTNDVTTVYLRGTTEFPSFDSSPKAMFRKLRRPQADEHHLANRTFYEADNTMDFGPLLMGRSREDFKGQLDAPNAFPVSLHNPHPYPIQVNAALEKDVNFATFVVEPATQAIAPGNTGTLHVFAFPKDGKVHLDSLILTTTDAPMAWSCNIRCEGVSPALELDAKAVSFERILLRRTDTKILTLRNTCKLPVCWQLVGLEQLSAEASASAAKTKGTVDPLGEMQLPMHFRSLKPITITKKVRSDSTLVLDCNSLGVIKAESLAISAEAYDVALDVTFPRADRPVLDFETMRVFDEKTLQCTLKNKGRYEIAFKLEIDRSVLKQYRQYLDEDCILMTPASASLPSLDKTVVVKFVFRTRKEVTLDNVPLLRCKVIEPHMNEVIASIPINVSARSVFSRYALAPQRGINFGAVLMGSKPESREIVLENTGDYEFRFTVSRRATVLPSTSNRTAPFTPRSGGRRSADLANSNISSNKLVTGAFSVYPVAGVVPAGQSTRLQVDVDTAMPGRDVQSLTIDVEQRSPDDHPHGLSYDLSVEVCKPGVALEPEAIFAEHSVCRRFEMQEQSRPALTYSIEDETFSFGPLVIGTVCQARLKLLNPTKVDCTVNLVCRGENSVPNKNKVVAEPFSCSVQSLRIRSHECQWVPITFNPTAIQTYSAMFEATVEEGDSTASSLRFKLEGSGILPRVSLVQPTARSAEGLPLLRFDKTLVGQERTRTVIVRNDGPIDAAVSLRAYSTQPRKPARVRTSATSTRPASSRGGRRDEKPLKLKEKDKRKPAGRPLRLEAPLSDAGDAADTSEVSPRIGAFEVLQGTDFIFIAADAEVSFDVRFTPGAPEAHGAQLQLVVENNEFDTAVIEVAGMGFLADLTLEDLEEADGDYLLRYPPVAVGETIDRAFTLVNNSDHVIRYDVRARDNVTVSPRTGHIWPQTTAQLRAILQSDDPLYLMADSDRLLCDYTRVRLADGAPVWHNERFHERYELAEDEHGGMARIKVKEPLSEPAYERLQVDDERITVQLEGVVDFARVNLDAKSLHFAEVPVFETVTKELMLHNPGDVNATFEWVLDNDDLNADASVLPFELVPAKGVLRGHASQRIEVRFAPRRAGSFDGSLECKVQCLLDTIKLPVLDISGKAFMPVCHLDWPDSDYVTSGRRRHDLPGPSGIKGELVPDLRVMEFSAVGLGVLQRHAFPLINPGRKPIEFVWRPLNAVGTHTAKGLQVGPFTCQVPEGRCLPNEPVTLSFTYAPSSLDIVETFWEFTVKDSDFRRTFLLVGHSEEPRLHFDVQTLDLAPLLLNKTVTQTITLINEEARPFNFAFDAAQLAAINKGATVAVMPTTGRVDARSQLPIRLSFTPKLEQPYVLNVLCDVRRKPTPLAIQIRAEGYRLHSRLELAPMGADSATAAVPLSFDETGMVPLEFGQVHVNEVQQRNFFLVNTGKFPLDATSRGGMSQVLEEAISIEPRTGTIGNNGRVPITVTFHPRAALDLRGALAQCTVHNGRKYRLELVGAGKEPDVAFDTDVVRFGKTFVQRENMPVREKEVMLVNRDTHPVSVACLFEDTTGPISVQFTDGVLKPGEQRPVMLQFRPTKLGVIKEEILFQLNSLTNMRLKVTGTPVPLLVQLENPKHRHLNFGVVEPGTSVARQATLINKSALPVEVDLAMDEHAMAEHGLTVALQTPVTLPPQGSLPLKFTYSPRAREPAFTQDVSIKYLGQLERLLQLAGACQGVVVQLDHDQLAFSGVVDSRSTRRLIMTNTGDIGARFQWDTASLGSWFTISPVEGYISPGLEVAFAVTFHPVEIGTDVRCEGVPCRIEGCAEPLYLDLVGTAAAKTADREVLTFNTEVRRAETRSFKVHNSTAQRWDLNPVLEHEYFTGPESLTVEPGETKLYTVTYLPLTMTSTRGARRDDGRWAGFHNGSVFLALPNGDAKLVLLTGQAQPPSPVGIINREVPCKMSVSIPLKVVNWLPTTQRFQVKINKTRYDVSTTLQGHDYLDVPAKGETDYMLTFHAYREGLTQADVAFFNETTQEYVTYELMLKAVPSGRLDVINLSTVVRQPISHTLSIENPLPQPLSLTVNSLLEGSTKPCSELHHPAVFRVPAKATAAKFTFEYLPLLTRTREAKLVLQCPELGMFVYDLNLEGLPAGPAPTKRVTAHLGEALTFRYTFVNLCSSRCDYTVTIDGSKHFHGPPSLMAPAASKAGTEVSIEMSFEPTQLGDSKATMTLASPVGGVYTCPLFGQCLPPRPSGPHVIKPGGKLALPFKNVFTNTETFSYTVDQPQFNVRSSDLYKAGESKEIQVRFDGDGQERAGKLIVTCASGAHSGIEWVFYLKGHAS
ncbi:uncharacterized protein MONBRDRAFT_18473 [Monosiga brevicollis MX1]|uniref:Uncharacterized protein n=1 Tax=Monosiga brevicollis TaxID=81824 RepID=A9UVY4_MONBE|nr:uncharacterized protein MONBRDRAFT_18473 [Monosiga brevicollis MX1]EDQ90671.1 predicted protein [Monosiga brevicollis MX1]|eukprot:XP_001744722.1 hypothetical protein [Monosiga brevicollis MX1]